MTPNRKKPHPNAHTPPQSRHPGGGHTILPILFSIQAAGECALFSPDLERKTPQAKGPKKNINFFNINFLAPTRNTPFWVPRKKFMCLISWERTHKRDPHKLFGGDFWGQKGGPKRAIFGHKKSSLLFFFLPLQARKTKKSEKVTKTNLQIPHPVSDPENTKALPYQNKNGHKTTVAVFVFLYFLRISGARPGVTDLVVFFLCFFLDFWASGILCSIPRLRNHNP